MLKKSAIAVLAAFAIFSIPPLDAYAGEVQGLRKRLIDSEAVGSLYSIDENYTLVAGKKEELASYLKNVCAEAGGELQKEAKGGNDSWDAVDCKGSFEAVSANDGDKTERSFFIRHSTPQPLIYKAKGLPPIESVSTPKNGEIKAGLNGFDAYEFAYALCAKNKGTPAYVVPKRMGKYVRFLQVNALEAFSYFVSPDDRKDAWFFACEGEKRFIVENYMYTPGGDNRFYFYSNRGLDGISYLKPDKHSYMAGLKDLQRKDTN